MNGQWVQDGVSIAGTLAVLGLAWLAKQKGWIGKVAREAERVVDPAVNIVEDTVNGAKADVVIHDVKAALEATTKQAQDALVEALIQRYSAAAKTEVPNLTTTQLGGLVSYVESNIPASWQSLITPSVVQEAVKAAGAAVIDLATQEGFKAVQAASAVIHQ